MVNLMSDMFESLELNMREEAERVNPTKAIIATQLECEQRFESFVSKNPERVDFLSDDIRSVADKYAAEYNIPSETIYDATVTHLKEAAVRKNSYDYEDLFDDGQSRIINDFVGSNMIDLDQIEMYFNQYVPEIESTLHSPYDESRHQQLQAELEHLKKELEGIGTEEEENGEERYWNLREQINNALSSLNDNQQRQTFSSVEKEAEWDKPWTEEDESKEESEESEAHEESESEEEEEKEHEDEEEEKKESSVKIAEVSLVPPEGVRSAAKRGIKYHSEGKAGDGFESATLARAKRIAAGEELTPEHVKRMHSFFERHAGGRSDKAGQGEITPWDVAWLAWGGNAGRSWAASKVEELERAEKTSAKKCDCWEGYKRVPGTKPCSPGSCEKCDSHRKKEAAIEDFILSNEDELVPEWIKKNAGWREMLRGFMNKKELFDPYDAAEWSSKDKPLPARARRMQEAEDINEQPTIEFSPARSDSSEYEDMIEDQSRAEEKMKENARKRQEMFESEPEYKTRGQHRYEYLRGASVQALEEFYVAQGMPAKTASILVEAVGEMAQLQTNEPGLPVGSSDPDSINIDKEIGGSEGDKYKNLDVAQKQKELGLEHQDFTDFGEPVREFIQPGGEAPYSENTKKRIDDAEQDNLNAKGVKQDDNAPKKSSASVKEADNNRAAIDELIEYARRGMRALREASKIDEKDGFSWDNAKWNQEEENLKQEILLLAEDMVNQPLSSLRDLEHYIPGAYGEIESFLSSSVGYQMSPEELTQMAENDPDEFIDRFASMDPSEAQIEELMKQGMTPEQAIQSLDVYNKDIPKGWGGSKTRAT